MRPLSLLNSEGANKPPPQVTMQGCETGGYTFALAYASIGADEIKRNTALLGWKMATQLQMSGSIKSRSPFTVLSPGPEGKRVGERLHISGHRIDGRAVEAQAVYFADATQVYQAIVLAPEIKTELADAFFTGLRLR